MDSLFFVVSKLFWALVRIETWFVLLILLALWALSAGRVRRARGILWVTLLAFLAIGFLPLGDRMLHRLESTHAVPELSGEVDGIIILGGAEDGPRSAFWGVTQVNEAAERIIAGAILARAHSGARVVFTGGSGALIQVEDRGADWAGRMLVDLGVAPERLVLERQSRNTAENAVMSRRLAEPVEGEVWVLVTSGFHMPRALQSFAGAGWTGIVPYPVDFRSLPEVRAIGWDPAARIGTLNLVLKEGLGTLAYRFFNR